VKHVPSELQIVMVGPFGLRPRMTMRMRALPLGKALVRRGHNVTLLLPPWQNPEDAGRAWEEEGVRIENVRLPRGVPGWFHWRLTADLVRRTRQLAPDVVHAFKPKAYAGLVHRALAGRYPIVVDTDDWEGPGGWNARGDYPSWMQRFFTWQEHWGLRRADAVTVASRALQTLAWSVGGDPERVAYLPNGVRVPSHTEGRQSVPGDRPRSVAQRPTVLLYTRFLEYDLAGLWHLFQTVRVKHPKVRYLVVGQGFHGEEAQLLQLARDAGWSVAEGEAILPEAPLPDVDLVYAGWGTEQALPSWFSAADLAIYPFDDTLLNRTKCPVKLLDLLAAGVPVVAESVGQIAEIVVEGETGALVNPGETAAFAEKVLMLLSVPERLDRMRAAAREDVARRYGWDELAGAAERAYRYALYR
jgi:glycosyltransferase involved in cell wall biosynthesis